MNKLKFWISLAVLFSCTVEGIKAYQVIPDDDTEMEAVVQEVIPITAEIIPDDDDDNTADRTSLRIFPPQFRRKSRQNGHIQGVEFDLNENEDADFEPTYDDIELNIGETNSIYPRFGKWFFNKQIRPYKRVHIYKRQPPTVVVIRREEKKKRKKRKKHKPKKKHQGGNKKKQQQHHHHHQQDSFVFNDPFIFSDVDNYDLDEFNRYPYVKEDYGYYVRPPKRQNYNLGIGAYGGYNDRDRYGIYDEYSSNPLISFNNEMDMDAWRYRQAVRRRLLLKQLRRQQLLAQKQRPKEDMVGN